MTDETLLPDDVMLMRAIMRMPPHVLDALDIDPTPGVTYHISPVDTIENFVPRKCQRTMVGEDELVARVCTADTLIGCLRGYAVTVRDFIKARATNAGTDSWRGGYYIYAIPHKSSVFPGRKLCPMSRWVKERWLVSYLTDEQVYPAYIVGKIFIHKATNPGVEQVGNLAVELMVEVHADALPWDEQLTLGKGYHAIHVPGLASYFDERFDADEYDHRPVSYADYMQAKGLKAELLSYSSAAAWGGVYSK